MQGAELQPTPRAEGDKPAAALQQPAPAHCSSIVALQRSPFLDALVLSAGGWDWALWLADDLAAPLLRSPVAPVIYTAAAWSPTRPGAAQDMQAHVQRTSQTRCRFNQRML